MAKKATTTEPVRRAHIASTYFEGYLDEMPIEAKDRMKAEKPEIHKRLFGEEVQSII